jgi:hypothetical protein
MKAICEHKKGYHWETIKTKTGKYIWILVRDRQPSLFDEKEKEK